MRFTVGGLQIPPGISLESQRWGDLPGHVSVGALPSDPGGGGRAADRQPVHHHCDRPLSSERKGTEGIRKHGEGWPKQNIGGPRNNAWNSWWKQRWWSGERHWTLAGFKTQVSIYDMIVGNLILLTLTVLCGLPLLCDVITWCSSCRFGRDVIDDPLRGLGCTTIAVFYAFYINRKLTLKNPKETLQKQPESDRKWIIIVKYLVGPNRHAGILSEIWEHTIPGFQMGTCWATNWMSLEILFACSMTF